MKQMQLVDATKATGIAKKYFISAYGNLAEFSFKVTSVEPNQEKNAWKVYCEVYTTPKDTSPTLYLVRVDMATGRITYIQPPTQNERGPK